MSTNIKWLHVQCSFCGKTQDEVRKLIAAPAAFICDECVVLAYEILLEQVPGFDAPDGIKLQAMMDELAIARDAMERSVDLLNKVSATK